jgi:hypothetical protein
MYNSGLPLVSGRGYSTRTLHTSLLLTNSRTYGRTTVTVGCAQISSVWSPGASEFCVAASNICSIIIALIPSKQQICIISSHATSTNRQITVRFKATQCAKCSMSLFWRLQFEGSYEMFAKFVGGVALSPYSVKV